MPSPPSERAIRRHGALVFATLPLLLLVLFQSIYLFDMARMPDWDMIRPTLILAPVVAMTGACGYSFAPQCARSSKIGIVMLAIAIGVALGIGLEIITLIAKGKDVLVNLTPARLCMQTARLSAFLTPLALLHCFLVRRYSRRGSNNVPGAVA